MNQYKSRIGQLVMLAMVAGVWLPAEAATRLQQIKVNPLLADQVQLELSFDQPVASFSDRLNYQPNRLMVQVSDAASGLNMSQIPVERQGVQQVKVIPNGSNLDVQIDLSKLMPYQISQSGNSLLVTLGQSKAGESNKPLVAKSAPAATAAATTPVAKQPYKPSAGSINRVKSIDFRRGKNGQGQLMVGLDNSSAALDVSSRGNHVIAKFHATDIGDDLVALMDVTDFATPVGHVDVSRQGNTVVMDLSVTGGFDYRYDQAQDMFIVEVSQRKAPTASAPSSATANNSSTGKYQGKPISLNFQDVPVRTVLQLIADFNGFNLVTTDSVAGNITLRLDGVPWEQALDTVLKVKGLDKRLEDNILLVAPAEEIAKREKQSLESKNQVAELSPLVTEYIQINYAKAGEIAELLSTDKTRLLSSRGAVSVDDRTNTLLVKDTADVIDHIKKMLTVLDIPVKQVVIEARMVTIDDGVDEQLGVRWGVTKAEENGSISGTIEGNNSAQTGTQPAVDKRLNVNLPVGNPAGSIAFQVAKLADGTLLDLELTALENENKAEIIASPRVTTANQKEAIIEQGTEFPSNTSSSSGATTVEWKKAVLSLKVTPQITPDNRVILDLTVTQDTMGQEVKTGTGTGTAVNTQQISTQVLVDNGETLVLGGIYQQTIKKDVKKVPVLGDIPGVGFLFRNSSQTNKKRELLIFVTPKIVTESL
ncbi:MAG: type IV pilus secretin PilQ [Aeromonadaceae bacterium]